ncbi:MAG: D-glycero-beta-D-manno-heptose 1-phosphate adenylyltransferase [Desulfurivibrionaceae bacterium]|nr:D-glycero-beta-D-manno-heptose 1-phosphate adenylyltransferase [Desulfurivibrionaceae bacterium]
MINSPSPLPPFAACLQIDVTPQPQENFRQVRAALARLAPQPGTLVVLPEMWLHGFSYQNLPEQAGQTAQVLEELRGLAGKYEILLAGSLPELEQDQIFNTLFIVSQSGIVGGYRKQHSFAPMQEDRHFSPGESLDVLLAADSRLGGLVCYDLRFPELARIQVQEGAQILIVCGQWPQARISHWRLLLQARAVENQVFVVACNRVGITDGTRFGGHSMIIAPDGTILGEGGDGTEVMSAGLAADLPAQVRQRFNTAGPRPWRLADKKKVDDLISLTKKRALYKECGQKVVFTNGCFDILHEGHVTYLEAARRQGDRLVVGLNSDSSIQAIKGPDRPVNSEASRARILAALGCVDHVILFSQPTPWKAIMTLMPDVLVKGSDWPVDQIVGAREVLAAGGEVRTIEFVGGFSTTALIKKIRRR